MSTARAQPVSRIACVAIGLASLVVVGDGRSTTPRSFAASMDAICLAGTKRANAIGQVATLDDLARLGPRLVAVDEWELRRLSRLGRPPQQVGKYVAQFIAAQRQLNGLGEKAVAAARRGDAQSAEHLSGRSAAFARIQETDAREIGAPSCRPSLGAR